MMIPYYDFGGHGPLLHFAHSNGYPPACFRQMAAPLLNNYHVVGICFRPLWPDSHPEELSSWRIMSDDLYHFIQQQGYKNIIGVGHSLGAVATMKTAYQFPHLFRALILIEPVFMPPDFLNMLAINPELAKQYPLYQKTINRRNTWPQRKDAFDHFRPKKVFHRWSDEALWDYINYGLHTNEQGEVELAFSREWEAQIYTKFPLDVWEEIPQVPQPTLAVRGADTDTLFPQAWDLWQKLQPQATFIEIPDVGHMVPMERPQTVAAIIADYLNKLD
ncbi:MAG: alpha/beta hydrolase [Candidatus Promineifilaceae bacterium]|nr:alpha/beta hydrolase [Candidatus Promineifilaceae bacterium]